MKKRENAILIAPLYIFTTLFVFLPIGYIVYLSFQERARVWGFVNEFTLENYMKILEPVYLKTFIESLKLAVITTICVILLGYPYGYFIAKMNTKAKRVMMILLMLPFWINSLIRLNGWVIVFRANGILDKILMATGLTQRPIKLLYSYPAVVFGMIYALIPFMILSVYSNVEKMDWTLVEAARDMGASSRKAFLTITLPMTMPGLLSGIVLTFIPSMGLFFIADILGGNKIVLIGSTIHEQITQGRNMPFAAALSVILMILTSLILLINGKISRTHT